MRITECAIEVNLLININANKSHHTIMKYEKAKCALDHLQAERQAQNDRLQLAADAKHKLNAALHTQLPISNRVFRAN